MARIAIFDSGVGGLSIYQALDIHLTGHEFVFVSDNQSYPYGNKAENWLIQRVLELGQCVVDRCSPDVLIVACNTASTIVLPALRKTLDIPIVGVVPAIKPAARLSKTKHFGLLATPGTITRKYTDELINEFASDCQISKVGSIKLVELAEQKLRGIPIDLKVLEAELEPFIENEEVDILVLACTHFPLLNNEITEVFKANSRNILLLDSGQAISNRVSALIDEFNIPVSTTPQQNQAFFTREIESEDFLIKQLEKRGLAYQGEL